MNDSRQHEAPMEHPLDGMKADAPAGGAAQPPNMRKVVDDPEDPPSDLIARFKYSLAFETNIEAAIIGEEMSALLDLRTKLQPLVDAAIADVKTFQDLLDLASPVGMLLHVHRTIGGYSKLRQEFHQAEDRSGGRPGNSPK